MDFDWLGRKLKSRPRKNKHRFSYINAKTKISSSRQLTSKNHSNRTFVNNGVSKSSRRCISKSSRRLTRVKRTTTTANKMSSVSTNTFIVARGRSDTSKTKGIGKRKRLESEEKLEGESVAPPVQVSHINDCGNVYFVLQHLVCTFLYNISLIRHICTNTCFSVQDS